MNDDLMLAPEVALRWRISVETLRFWRSTNQGPPSFKVGRRIFYRRSEVEAWFARQESATRRGDDS